MGTPLSTIGVKIGYAAGVIGTAETTFTHIPDMKSTPDFATAPNTADASTFDNEEYTTYVELLKDLGGAVQFTANLTDAFRTAWNAAVSAATTNSAKGCWFAIDIPGITESVRFFGMPAALGLPALTANSLMEATVSITPYTEPEWATGITVS